VTDPVSKPVLVSNSQGLLDLTSAGLRLILVILSTAPAAALLLRKGDLVGLYNYFQSQPGVALTGAVSGLAALGYGLYKSFKRGAQISTVAADTRVPSSVADIK
jgi:hypothetical protein